MSRCTYEHGAVNGNFTTNRRLDVYVPVLLKVSVYFTTSCTHAIKKNSIILWAFLVLNAGKLAHSNSDPV